MAGTLSRSIPAPCSGDGATTTISGSTVCAAAPPGWASNPAPSATPKAACRAPRRRGGLEAMRTLSPGGFLKNLPPAGATSFGPPGSEVSVPLGKPGGKIWQRDFTATLRVRHTRRRAPCRAKQRLPVSAVGLLQQAQQGLAGAGTQFLVVQGAVVVRIGGLEPFLDLLEVLVLGQRSVLVGIRSIQLPGAHAAAQFAAVERGLANTVEAAFLASSRSTVASLSGSSACITRLRLAAAAAGPPANIAAIARAPSMAVRLVIMECLLVGSAESRTADRA